MEGNTMQQQGERKGTLETLTFADICKIRQVSIRTGIRERIDGRWPNPSFTVGTGTRQSPRWLADLIREWLATGGRPAGKAAKAGR
jgi:hypothetical protein